MALEEKNGNSCPYTDMRIMTLKRYNKPLSFDEMDEELSKEDTYVSFNNYHFISIEPGPRETDYPISAAYLVSREARAQVQQNVHVLQTSILFGDRADY